MESLNDRCESVFESILKGTTTVEMIAQVFSNLKAKGYNYSEVKTALLKAGVLEPQIETDTYTRQDLMRIFNWQDRSLRDNLLGWGVPHLLKTYKKSDIHEAASKAGWVYSAEWGAWQKPRPKKANEVSPLSDSENSNLK